MNKETKVSVNKCRHWNGLLNETCKAGVKYADVAKIKELGRFGLFYRLPCIHEEQSEFPCACLSRLNDEEIAKQERQTNNYLEKFLRDMPIARAAIVADIANRKREYVSGSIPCPICGTGTIAYTYAGHYNRHIHAKCTTDKCMNWGE